MKYHVVCKYSLERQRPSTHRWGNGIRTRKSQQEMRETNNQRQLSHMPHV